MTLQSLKNKEYIIRITWAVVSMLLTCTFFLFSLYAEHKEMVKEFPSIQIEQRRLAMSDTLMNGKIERILIEQKISKKVLYKIANKLHVEIPVE